MHGKHNNNNNITIKTNICISIMFMSKYVLSFRISNNETELTTTRDFIRRNFSGSQRFSPTDLVIVTWDRVSSYENGTAEVWLLQIVTCVICWIRMCITRNLISGVPYEFTGCILYFMVTHTRCAAMILYSLYCRTHIKKFWPRMEARHMLCSHMMILRGTNMTQ